MPSDINLALSSTKIGAERMIHVMQHVIIQNFVFDISSADPVKALYTLNRDLALKKLKDNCPIFSLRARCHLGVLP